MCQGVQRHVAWGVITNYMLSHYDGLSLKALPALLFSGRASAFDKGRTIGFPHVLLLQ